MSMPGFTAEASLEGPQGPYLGRHDGTTSRIVPAIGMPYCKTVCGWQVCGSALPGYPTPMCWTCRQQCWWHDSGTI